MSMWWWLVILPALAYVIVYAIVYWGLQHDKSMEEQRYHDLVEKDKTHGD